MVVLFFLLLALCLWGIKFSAFHREFLSKNHTTPIKGIFTFLIFSSHVRKYITLSDNLITTSYTTLLDYIGQMVVAIFFFYSGFGIWESFMHKPDYHKTFLKNRFLKTLLHFDIAIAIIILVQLFIPIVYSPREYLLCWIGWESVGNYNWFIFVILCLYLVAMAALFLQAKNGKGGILLATLLTAVLWVLLNCVAKRPWWWVDTIAVFPLGMLVSRYKDQIIHLLEHKYVPFVLTGVSFVALFLAYKAEGIDIYGGIACPFCIMVILLSACVKVGNPVLNWLGKNAFTIYVIQCLPMIVFSELGINSTGWLFILLTVVFTALLAEGLSRLYSWLDARISLSRSALQ